MSSQAEKVSSPTKPGFSNFTRFDTVYKSFQEYVTDFAVYAEKHAENTCPFCGTVAHCTLTHITSEFNVLGNFECENGHQFGRMVTKDELYESYQKSGKKKLLEVKRGGRK